MARVHASRPNPGLPRTSWRVRFNYRDDDIWPVSAIRTAMLAPGGVAPPEDAGEMSGAWIEVVGGERGVRWARSISQPNRADLEAFPEEGAITRVRREEVEGEFELIIPDFGEEATFVLHSSPAHKPEAAADARVRVGLSELARLGDGRKNRRPERDDDKRSP